MNAAQHKHMVAQELHEKWHSHLTSVDLLSYSARLTFLAWVDVLLIGNLMAAAHYQWTPLAFNVLLGVFVGAVCVTLYLALVAMLAWRHYQALSRAEPGS